MTITNKEASWQMGLPNGPPRLVMACENQSRRASCNLVEMNASLHRHSDRLLFTKIKDSINAVEMKFNMCPTTTTEQKKRKRKKEDSINEIARRVEPGIKCELIS